MVQNRRPVEDEVLGLTEEGSSLANQGWEFSMIRRYQTRYSGGYRLWKRGRTLQQKYGITLGDYNRMLESQGGGCAICGESPKKGKKLLAVDHNHKTGEVRGLLCGRCNAMIGFSGDAPDLLKAAIRYLENWVANA